MEEIQEGERLIPVLEFFSPLVLFVLSVKKKKKTVSLSLGLEQTPRAIENYEMPKRQTTRIGGNKDRKKIMVCPRSGSSAPKESALYGQYN